jgi:hypothetical protein
VNQDGKGVELPQIEWLALCEDEWERDGNSPRIVYTPRSGMTSEAEVEILANVYSFLLRCHESRKAAEMAYGDEGEEAAEPGHAEGVAPEKRKS